MDVTQFCLVLLKTRVGDLHFGGLNQSQVTSRVEIESAEHGLQKELESKT